MHSPCAGFLRHQFTLPVPVDDFSPDLDHRSKLHEANTSTAVADNLIFGTSLDVYPEKLSTY
jgi:hypothetical protein